jgi:FdrA protein
MGLKTEIVPAFYQDSVVLMRISAQVRTRLPVREVALFMGTPANHALLQQAGLATAEGEGAGPNDLIVTVSADDEGAAAEAIDAVRELLAASSRAREASTEHRPRTLDAALRALPEANLAAISIPGPYVRDEAMAALRRNLHLFIFSDNVPVADEIALKQEAVRRGLLCMGPDQGTAYLGGVGLGFANVVARGRVGCVAASGTGLQAVVSRLDALGEGVSHAIGVGGRDLSEAVGGTMTLFALDALAADPGTQGIVLVSKPPHPSVLERVEARLAAMPKPAVVCCVGARPRGQGKVVWVDTLHQAAEAIVAAMAGERWERRRLSDPARVGTCLRSLADAGVGARGILGLYTGGTLAYEAEHILRDVFGPRHPHRILDLGDDEYTVGRPHPMIDPRMRGEMIVRAGGNPQVGVLLVDLVLGRGAHDNPAAALVEAVDEARRIARSDGRGIAVLACVIGTAGDPQGLASQTALLEEAGIATLATNADAARCAAMSVHPQLRAEWLREVA